jgi:ribosome maturation factor RimP
VDADRISEIVAPIVTTAGLELYDVEQAGEAVRVLVNGPEGSIDLGELAELSRTISLALDLEDPVPGNYTLEVSSPGLERQLRRADHFASAIGELITVRTTPGADGRRRLRGALIALGDDCITIEDPDAGAVELRLDEVESARTVFEWGPAPKPGRQKATPSAKGQRR